jgi:hypothetical protein
MKNPQPIFDPATHYRIEMQGQVDVKWLKRFDSSAEIIVDKSKITENTIVLDVNTDQAGIVGLVRRLHGLGITILQVQVVKDEE